MEDPSYMAGHENYITLSIFPGREGALMYHRCCLIVLPMLSVCSLYDHHPMILQKPTSGPHLSYQPGL